MMNLGRKLARPSRRIRLRSLSAEEEVRGLQVLYDEQSMLESLSLPSGCNEIVNTMLLHPEAVLSLILHELNQLNANQNKPHF